MHTSFHSVPTQKHLESQHTFLSVTAILWIKHALVSTSLCPWLSHAQLSSGEALWADHKTAVYPVKLHNRLLIPAMYVHFPP